jgi:hypothetical protein
LVAIDQSVVLAGDYNVIPTEFDAYKPERWVDDALFFPAPSVAGDRGGQAAASLTGLPAGVELLTRFMVTNWAMTGFQGMLWDQLPWNHSRMLTAIGIQWAFAVTVSTVAFWFYRGRDPVSI